MTPVRLAASLGGATLLLAWLAHAAAVPPRAQIVSRQPSRADVVLDTLASDVQAQAVRLRQRLADAPAPAAPTRNPFAFRVREYRTRPGAFPEPAVATESLERLPAAFPLVLDGIAEQQTGTGLVRTAIISAPGGELFLVTEGQIIAERYAVVAVTTDVVELKDLTTGETRRLVLQQYHSTP